METSSKESKKAASKNTGTEELLKEAKAGQSGDGNQEKATATVEGVKKAATTGKASVTEYTADELANAARTKFNTSYEVVKAALADAGRERAGVEETKELIKTFLKRKVR